VVMIGRVRSQDLSSSTGVASACDGVVVVGVDCGGTVRRETRTGATKKKNQTPRACV